MNRTAIADYFRQLASQQIAPVKPVVVVQVKKPENSFFPAILNDFMGKTQQSIVLDCLKGEEKAFFRSKMAELAHTIEKMPKTYEQDGKGENAVAYLHYFKGSQDWYILEKDKGHVDDVKNGIPAQSQAFGLADLFQDGGEVGYISIHELISNNVELDFYWTPKTVKEIRAKK